ncbi:DUF3667 domain-containing protein [uncultured Dokdonia sp.]|uniref:DUF3667 domain-containing protein n=1 Tax=uncultured Dokdonia sp. TaxID=575653 RepID=UPI0030ECA888|tara:strand:- start:14416 stop:15111 length:696 start_codon:yes stop_codon:yes gene_type:complete
MNESFGNDKEKENLNTLERIDGKYIWDEISSVLNFDKGIFYTIKELIIRPGKTVHEFLIHDRKRIVKPVIFVIFSSLFFVIIQQILGFSTGTAPDNIPSAGVKKAFDWCGKNFGIMNIIMGFFIGFWIRLFFLKSKINIYEIFILVFFSIGIVNLIYTFFGIIESVTGFEANNITYVITIFYSTWAVGNFFNKKKISSYVRGFLANLLGTTTASFLIVIAGLFIDFFNKIS